MTIYISDFRRPLAERLQKDFFSDPSQASVACVRTGAVTMRGIDMSKAGGAWVVGFMWGRGFGEWGRAG